MLVSRRKRIGATRAVSTDLRRNTEANTEHLRNTNDPNTATSLPHPRSGNTVERTTIDLLPRRSTSPDTRQTYCKELLGNRHIEQLRQIWCHSSLWYCLFNTNIEEKGALLSQLCSLIVNRHLISCEKLGIQHGFYVHRRNRCTYIILKHTPNVVVTFSWNLYVVFWAFLAHLVMSLCNHALSVVCRCRRRRRRRPCRRRRRLCTALPVTGLIIETSYLANICSYTPSICT